MLVIDMQGKHQRINFQTLRLLINQALDHLTNKKVEEVFFFGLGERPDPSHVVSPLQAKGRQRLLPKYAKTGVDLYKSHHSGCLRYLNMNNH